ncbi:hypothetical protein [Segetibacter koreensis]|uniref:hypothetical protein n=1 Tax=Segetibacter koreensis TaxID=398037 RepID=UPI0003747407|nr:hypothetical protein [Segetibacter koreensis]
MIQIEETITSKIIFHRISSEENKCIFSNSLFDSSDDNEESVFKKIFLKPFLSHSLTFEFKHEVDMDYNILFNLSKAIYEGGDFIEKSKDISQHLISVSKHPHIKDGDFFVVKFDDIKLNNESYEGVGLYKFEDKESYIDTSVDNKEAAIKFRKGIGSRKPDKACLIIFAQEPYTLFIIDNNSNETEYWQNDFIKHKAKNDFINNTSNFLTLTKDFITAQIPTEYDVSKADQIDLLNRSVEYFKTHETFDKTEFEEEVFHHTTIIDSFRKFDETYRHENDMELSDNFEISEQAVKKQARVFKRVLKLDKNFHIYIHGNRELIEQGVDENGRKFYKIYYEEES